MRRTCRDLPEWIFDIDEVSAGVYRVIASDVSGPRLSVTGANPDELIRAALRRALGACRSERALHRIRDAHRVVKQELALGASGLAITGTLLQLESIQQSLSRMERELATSNGPPSTPSQPGMGRMICDSWPLNSPLGALVLAAEWAYCNCWKPEPP